MFMTHINIIFIIIYINTLIYSSQLCLNMLNVYHSY